MSSSKNKSLFVPLSIPKNPYRWIQIVAGAGNKRAARSGAEGSIHGLATDVFGAAFLYPELGFSFFKPIRELNINQPIRFSTNQPIRFSDSTGAREGVKSFADIC